MFPTGLIDETIRTLALFLPQSDPLTRKWFRKLSLTSDLDERAAHCARLKAADRHIDNFAFWRDRIVVLKQIFDEAEPSTLSQWWHDRRNGVQWYTFWVAIVVLILTLIFGLVQCIEGGIQAHAVLSPTT
jgi:CHASE1-domain containing sensor protein